MPRYEIEVEVRMVTTLRTTVDADDETEAEDRVYRIQRDLVDRAIGDLDPSRLDSCDVQVLAVRPAREEELACGYID